MRMPSLIRTAASAGIHDWMPTLPSVRASSLINAVPNECVPRLATFYIVAFLAVQLCVIPNPSTRRTLAGKQEIVHSGSSSPRASLKQCQAF
ncbi:hypothetical protein BDZ45DRAFT_426111 [Acephala macrosclerotiorum]|nr:hypothetical protein BDZ45DRAFT_426111 [Acephala macrosclerotiorum]